MVRLYTIGVESVSVSVLLLPAMLLGWELFRRNMPAVRKGMLLTFAVYLCAVYSATGLPDAGNFAFRPRLQLVPVLGVMKDTPQYLMDSLLNVVMFIPFGVFAPLLWRKLRSVKRTALAGLCFSFAIEMAQMFSGRLTDVDDLITNTLGAVIGCLIARVLYQKVVMAHGLHDTGRKDDIMGLPGMMLLSASAMFWILPVFQGVQL